MGKKNTNYCTSVLEKYCVLVQKSMVGPVRIDAEDAARTAARGGWDVVAESRPPTSMFTIPDPKYIYIYISKAQHH